MSISDQVIDGLLDAAGEFARATWRRLVGSDTDDDEDAIDTIKRIVFTAGYEAGLKRGAQIAADAGVALAVADLAPIAADVLRAFEARGTVPSLGLEIEEVAELPIKMPPEVVEDDGG